MKYGLFMSCALALALTACDDNPSSDAGADAAMADAGSSDAGPTDAGSTDAGSDGGTDACDGSCGSDELCVRAVCVEACGATAEALEAALGTGLSPVANFCRPAAARAFHEGEVWDVTTALEGTVTTFTLSRWTPDATGLTGLTEVGTATYDTGDAATMTFAGSYLAISPDGANVAFGYTDSTAGGDVVVRRMGSADLMLDGNGNFDAAFLDNSTLLVNGLALGTTDAGQGVYAMDVTASVASAVNVLSNLGMFSGSVAATADYVIAGGFEDGGFVYAVPRADLMAAMTTDALDVVTEGAEVLDAVDMEVSSTFTIVDGRLITLPFGGPVTSYATTWDGTDLTLTDATVVCTDGTFVDVIDAPEDRLLLVHGGGLLLVE
ncbi:MAG: hypothetical protein AB8I08_29625 [Sandaracinaceae bacterium]